MADTKLPTQFSSLRPIAVSQLVVGKVCEHPLYHGSATVLVPQGRMITVDHLRAFGLAGIKDVYEVKSEKDLYALAASTPKQPVPLNRVPVGTPVFHNIYDRTNRFLLRKGGSLNSAQHRRLKDLGVEEVFADEQKLIREVDIYGLELTKAKAKLIEGKFKHEEHLRITDNHRILGSLFHKSPAIPRRTDQIQTRKRIYKDQELRTVEFLDTLRSGKTISIEAIDKTAFHLVEELYADIEFTLNFIHLKDEIIGDFQKHTLNVATLAVGVGLALGYSEHNLRKLGTAALVHEVGMFRLPLGVLEKQDVLTNREKEEINNHPIAALEYLMQIKGLREEAALVVYQEHESPDRLGYPNKRPGYLIHDFAKILSICDAYDAMTTGRPYRQALPPYRAMEVLIQNACKMQYDPQTLRAFLRVVGLFPVGSWVKLSSGRFAKVVGGNPEKYDSPAVCELFDPQGRPLSQSRIIRLEGKEDVKVVDVEGNNKFFIEHEAGF